jgi:hypothetical protein
MDLATGPAEDRFNAHFARVRQGLAEFNVSLPATTPSDEQRLVDARRAHAAETADLVEKRTQPVLLSLVFFGPAVAFMAGAPAVAAWLSSVSFLLLMVVLLGDGLVRGFAKGVGAATARLAVTSPPPAVADPVDQLPSRWRNAYGIASSARKRLAAADPSVELGARAGDVENEADRLLAALVEGHGDGERLLNLAAEVVALEETLGEHSRIVEGRIAPRELMGPTETTAGALAAMSLRETAVEEALGDDDVDPRS